MALSSADRDNVRTYLGYSGRFAQVDSVLEQAMDSINGDSDAVGTIQALILSCQGIDTQLTAIQTRAGISNVDEIVVDTTKGLRELRSEGRRYVGRMAAKLGVPIRHDAFAASTANEAPAPGMGGGFYGTWAGAGGMMRMG